MAFPTGCAAQPPWANSAVLGEFVYRPGTDEIVTRDGRRFARPQHMQPNSLDFASYEGPLPLPSLPQVPFQYYGTPPGGTGNFVLGPGQTETVAQPTSQSAYLPLNLDHANPGYPTTSIVPFAAHDVEQSSRTRLVSSQTSSRAGPTHFILPQSDTNVVFTTPSASQNQRGEGAPQPSRNAQGIPINNDKLLTTLFPGYGPRRPNFYRNGRVFMILCSEPADRASVVTSWAPGIVMSRMGDQVFTPVRKFVVIDSGSPNSGFSLALPINTYGGLGVAKPGVIRSHHCIIHSSSIAPQPTRAEFPRRGEDGMRPVPIRVDLDNPVDRLDPMSRVHLAGPIQIHHGLRTRDIGVVSEQSERDLRRQFRNVWGDRPLPLPPRPLRPPRLQARRVQEQSDEEGDSGTDGED